jgi:hypothetical protein
MSIAAPKVQDEESITTSAMMAAAGGFFDAFTYIALLGNSPKRSAISFRLVPSLRASSLHGCSSRRAVRTLRA